LYGYSRERRLGNPEMTVIPDGRGVLLWRCGKPWFSQLRRQAQQKGREPQPGRVIGILGETRGADYTMSAEVYVVKRPQELVAVVSMSPELKVGAWSRKFLHASIRNALQHFHTSVTDSAHPTHTHRERHRPCAL